jgi:hypothetical protein
MPTSLYKTFVSHLEVIHLSLIVYVHFSPFLRNSNSSYFFLYFSIHITHCNIVHSPTEFCSSAQNPNPHLIIYFGAEIAPFPLVYNTGKEGERGENELAHHLLITHGMKIKYLQTSEWQRHLLAATDTNALKSECPRHLSANLDT